MNNLYLFLALLFIMISCENPSGIPESSEQRADLYGTWQKPIVVKHENDPVCTTYEEITFTPGMYTFVKYGCGYCYTDSSKDPAPCVCTNGLTLKYTGNWEMDRNTIILHIEYHFEDTIIKTGKIEKYHYSILDSLLQLTDTLSCKREYKRTGE